VVNKTFRDLLLIDPIQALDRGYQGEHFLLNEKERYLVLSIQAVDLQDFALQITSLSEGKSQEQSTEWIPVRQNALVLEGE
jgi:hypothetical protein